jgi:tetratricopeptide (TPR) repeat protein
MGFFGILSPSDAYQAAKENALKSLNLDPNNAEAHAALGRVLTSYEWNWSGAEAEFKRAIELNSNYLQSGSNYATLLIVTGRPVEALARAQHVLEEDNLSLSLTSGRAWLSYLARRYDESVRIYQRAVEMDPVSLQEIEGLAEAYEMSGRIQDAFETYQRWAKTGGMSASQIASLEQAYKKNGMKGYWGRRLEMEIEDEKGGNVWTYVMASLNARVGNKEQALTWLEKAYEEHHDRLIFLNVDPVFDSLRSDPRFLNLVKRVGLPL